MTLPPYSKFGAGISEGYLFPALPPPPPLPTPRPDKVRGSQQLRRSGADQDPQQADGTLGQPGSSF